MGEQTDTKASATLVTGGARPAVRLERELNEPPQALWRALTQPQGLRSWFPCEIVVERWQVGAALSFVFPGHEQYTMGGTVLACDPPRALAYTWGEETLRFELSATGAGGSRLVLLDELAPGIAARNAAGWDACLDRLAGRDTAPDAWRPRFERYTAAFEPLVGPQEGPPAGYKGD